MDDFFPDLFGVVSLKPSAEELAARWAAVASLAESPTRTRVTGLARLCAAAPGAEQEPVIEAARAADPAFQTVNSDLEVRVLASATLCHWFLKSSNVADAASLGISAVTLGGTRGDALVDFVQVRAKTYMQEEAVRVRAAGRISAEVAADRRAAAVRAYQAAIPAGPAGQSAAGVGEQIATLVAALSQPQVDAIDGLLGQLEALREESNMCWWVVGEFSHDLQKPFNKIKSPADCLVAARELARMTVLLPGPRSASAFLGRVIANGRRSTSASIPEAVNATPREWRKSWLSSTAPTHVGNLAPVLTAVQHSLATESKTDWVSAFCLGTGLDDIKLGPTELTVQAYTEDLLVQAVSAIRT